METMLRREAGEWSVASLTQAGESESGDQFVVEGFENGALVAVIDALGHGPAAAYAAGVAARTLRRNVQEAPAALIARCHAGMRTTRGAAISMASFDWRRRTMTWLGVGNVAGLLVDTYGRNEARTKSLLVRAGVVGDRLPGLHPLVMRVAPGDVLILATDGIRPGFAGNLPVVAEPRRLAQRILDDHATARDDATVLVFRCNGDT